MAYVYLQYQIDKNLKTKKPFYIGISNQPVIKNEEFTGTTPDEIIQNFINTPYIRMYDFGPTSHHGFKAKLSFEDAGEKSIEYQEFIKDKVWKVDYDAEVVFETDCMETIYFIEYLLVKKYGFRHDKGLLFNKIPGGCKKLKDGTLDYQFSFQFLLDKLDRGSLTFNPNWSFIDNNTNSEINGSIVAEDAVYSQNYLDAVKDMFRKKYKELENTNTTIEKTKRTLKPKKTLE
jgi:hypothetical protein